MKSTKNYLLLFVLSVVSFSIQAQTDIRSYSMKKGEAFDIIFLNTKPGSEDVQKKYFEKAFPIAKEGGYTPLKGLAIKDNPLQGNYHPEVMVFGTWASVELREKFVADIEKSVPDFHAMRREIWSTFNLTYWEVGQDYSFDIDPAKFNVVTAYWSGDDTSFPKFRKAWLKQVEKSGGNKLIGFFKGSSPFGYDYNPDHLTIIEWESKEAFDKFNEKIQAMDHQSVRHVNQFIVQ